MDINCSLRTDAPFFIFPLIFFLSLFQFDSARWKCSSMFEWPDAQFLQFSSRDSFRIKLLSSVMREWYDFNLSIFILIHER